MAKQKFTSKILPILMALMLVISCANITALAAGPGSSSSTSVDHIDIGVSLTADIMIDGVLYEDLTYTLLRSDLTAQNLKIYSSLGNHSYSLSNVSTSTGSSGIQQFRISGNFPVGTIDSPNYYTVQLSKTVTVATPSGDVTVPVVFSATFQYWDSHNDCPGLRGGRNGNSSWKNGSVVGGSGLDFLLGNAKADLNTKGTISIQKTVYGLALAEGESKTYTFDIYAEGGNLYDTISITIGSGSTLGLASISEVPYGTYYVVERDASAENYTLYTEYTVGTEVTADKSADLVLTADAPNGAVHVINAYSAVPVILDLTDVSVNKVWDDNGNPDRPGQVTVQLLQDGVYYGDAVVLNAANNWHYTWFDLDVGYDWSVIELNVPAGYTVSVQAGEAEDEFIITNSMDYVPPTEPETEPTTEPATEPETEPTEPETQPTEPETEPTEPETEPTEPETEPTEPDTEPTEPETEPTEPDTEPTEPETEPTEPDTEPTEPETQPTEPETEPTTEPIEVTEEETVTPGGGDPDPQDDDGMADVPQTGGTMLLWICASVLSGSGLILTLRKRED